MMPFQVLREERYLQNVERLLVSPDDLIVCGARVAGSEVEQRGIDAHHNLFRRYQEALKAVSSEVADWWFRAIAEREQALGSADEARKELIITFPAGPAQDPRFIRMVREFWLACDEINKDLPKENWVDPPRLLLGWIVNDGRDKLGAEVLASMPYWPVGMTESGEWM